MCKKGAFHLSSWTIVCSMCGACWNGSTCGWLYVQDLENVDVTRVRLFVCWSFLRTQWSTSNHSEWTRLRLRPLSHRGWLGCDPRIEEVVGQLHCRKKCTQQAHWASLAWNQSSSFIFFQKYIYFLGTKWTPQPTQWIGLVCSPYCTHASDK